MGDDMKFKKIPVSRAKTAWGLMLDVRRAIKNEPKRADMTTIAESRVGDDVAVPPCGTVGCVAGWIQLLSGRSVNNAGNSTQPACAILGRRLNYQTVGPDKHYVFNSGDGDACEMTSPGTKAHAKAVIHRIDEFMAINKVGLKAKKIR